MYMWTPSRASLTRVIIYTGYLCLWKATHTLTGTQEVGCWTTAHLKQQLPCFPGSTPGSITQDLVKAVSHFHNLAYESSTKATYSSHLKAFTEF